MWNVVIWALLTGGISAGVWAGIVLVSRKHRIADQNLQLLDEIDKRVDRLEDTDVRMTGLEERLDLTERLLTQRREPERQSRSDQG